MNSLFYRSVLFLGVFFILFPQNLYAEDAGKINHSSLIKKIAKEKGKPVVITFFASWCGPCRKEIKELIKMRKSRTEKELAVMAVSVEDNIKQYKKYLDGAGTNFPVYFGDAEIANSFSVSAIPKTVIYDPKGVRIDGDALVGVIPADILLAAIEAHIKKNSN